LVTTVTSAHLDVFATVPHCLDNQYLPRPALTDLLAGKIDIAAAERARSRSVRREYVRALLYSPTVILNRAFALNEPAVFQDVKDHPNSIAELIERERLVILMLKNDPRLPAILDARDPPFPVSGDGRRAWRRYLGDFGETQLRYVQITDDQHEAVVNCFPTFIRQLFRQEFDPPRFMELCTATGLAGDRLEAFRRFLRTTATPWLDRFEGRLVRTAVYKEFILPDGADISKPGIDRHKEFALEMKLLTDLAYNHNLPTALGRQSFVPLAMPNPLCLPRHLFRHGIEAVRANDERIAQDVTLRALSELWSYPSQQAYLVPDWADLSIDDVLHLQSWDEWDAFRKAQRQLAKVDSADQFDRCLHDFFDALAGFQVRMANAIESDRGVLKHVAAGARALKLLVSPVITWAGEALTPSIANSLVTSHATEAFEFAIDVIVEFFEGRAEARHTDEAARFRYRAAGWRRNVMAEIRESPDTRRQVERLAEQASPPPVEAPAQAV
jgi:hypothetical protein